MSAPEIRFNSLPDRAALGFLQNKKLLPGFSHYDVWMQEHAVAFTVAKMMDADMLADVRQMLADAIEQGTTFNDFKKQLKPYLMAKGWWGEQIMTDPEDDTAKLVQLGSTRRLRTIFHTNLATAHAAGQWARIQQNKRALPYLKYIPSYANSPRDGHKRYYNLILPVEHELWAQIMPPNGYGCLCGVRQLTRRQAMRERGEDIARYPDRFTDEQKADHEAGILNDKPDVPYIDFTNPRTGEVVRVPADITPTFAHNHGDRVAALDKMFGANHSPDALDKMVAEREAYLAGKMQPPPMMTTTFNDKADPKEVSRLFGNGKNDLRTHEALAAAQYQKAFGVHLEPFSPGGGDQKNKPDFIVPKANTPREQWQTIDFMFTADDDDLKTINGLNTFFASDDNLELWAKKIINMQKHFDKADIVPMDLRHLNSKNRAKLLAYVLSLPKTQQEKVLFIVRESK